MKLTVGILLVCVLTIGCTSGSRDRRDAKRREDRLAMQLADAQRERDEAKAQLAAANDAAEKARAAQMATKAEADSALGRVGKLQQDLDTAKSSSDASEAVRKELSDAQRNLADARNENRELHAQIDALKAQLNTPSTQPTDLNK